MQITRKAAALLKKNGLTAVSKYEAGFACRSSRGYNPHIVYCGYSADAETEAAYLANVERILSENGIAYHRADTMIWLDGE